MTHVLILRKEHPSLGLKNRLPEGITINYAEGDNVAKKGHIIENIGDGAIIAQGAYSKAIIGTISRSSVPDQVKVALENMVDAVDELNTKVDETIDLKIIKNIR